MFKKFFITVLFAVLFFMPASTAFAQTTFANLGAADSGGAGFKTVSTTTSIVVSNVMVNDGTAMYNPNHSSFTIKAYAVENFTFDAMTIQGYVPTAVDAGSTVVFKDRYGTVLQTMSLNADKVLSAAISLSTFFDNGTSTPINNVAEIVFNLGTPVQGYTANYNYNNITISQPPLNVAPTITTQAVSNISTETATGNGNLTDLGTPNPTQHGVCWNTGGTPTISDGVVNNGAASTTGAFTASITSLSPNTLYYVRAYATNTAGTSYGTQESFTTLPLPPAVATDPATGVTSTGATFNGIINANGVSSAVTFEYGLTTSYGTTVNADQSPVTGTADTPVSKSIIGLATGTTYHYRVIGVNTGGTTNGFDKSFTTIPGIPINVVISSDGSEVTVSWNSVTGATSYKVYSSTDPYSGFSLNTLGSFNGTSWTGPNSLDKLFYYVVAVN